MELRSLRYFVAIAEELHFGRAAKRLHISQPPLSRQLKQLETEIGSMLVARTRRQVALTEAGRLFLQDATRILTLVDGAIHTAQRAHRGEAGRLSVGFFIGATDKLLPPILRRFRTQSPKVELILKEMGIPDVLQSLLDRTIDVGFIRPTATDPSITSEVLLREPLVAAMPIEHPLAKKRALRLQDFAPEPFVMYLPGRSVLPGKITTACQKAGFDPRIVQYARYPDTLLGLVASGAGVALVPASMQSRGRSSVKFRKIGSPLPNAEIAIAWRRNDDSPLLGAFINTARASRKSPGRNAG